MKKIMELAAIAFFLFPFLNLYASDNQAEALKADKKKAAENIKQKRDEFYSNIKEKIKFNQTDINTVRQRGYSPFYGFVTLSIAKKAGAPLADVLKMIDDGYSWKDICSEYAIDYEKFITEVEKNIAKYQLIFPVSTYSEDEKDSATMPYKRKGAPK